MDFGERPQICVSLQRLFVLFISQTREAAPDASDRDLRFQGDSSGVWPQHGRGSWASMDTITSGGAGVLFHIGRGPGREASSR